MQNAQLITVLLKEITPRQKQYKSLWKGVILPTEEGKTFLQKGFPQQKNTGVSQFFEKRRFNFANYQAIAINLLSS